MLKKKADLAFMETYLLSWLFIARGSHRLLGTIGRRGGNKAQNTGSLGSEFGCIFTYSSMPAFQADMKRKQVQIKRTQFSKMCNPFKY